MDNINHRNYRRGLIKGYELAFQDKEWYKNNKNNFCNSIRENFPKLIPEYAKNSNVKNFLGFFPDDLIRFGYLEKVNMKMLNNDGKDSTFWVSKIPKGFSLYHSSRSLGLNHSDFPLIGYDNLKTPEENLTISQNICPTEKFLTVVKPRETKDKEGKEQIQDKSCTYISYYSTPYLSKGYLKRGEKGYAGNAVKYAYGVSPISEDPSPLYNDRLRVTAKITSNKINDKKKIIEITESTQGVSAYITDNETYLFILGIDDILINRVNLGKENMKTFYRIMYNMQQKELANSFSMFSEESYNKFLRLILSVAGIGTLQDNIDNVIQDYPQAKGFEQGLKNWISTGGEYYSKTPLKTAGLISQFKNVKTIQDFQNFPGIRFSTFEHDREVMNMVSWLFSTYPTYSTNNKQIQVSGFVSSSLYVYSKGKGDILQGEMFSIGDLTFYGSRSYFHSELGLFFAPNNLKRDRNNKYDLEYSFNYLGIVQEYRKFKTTNLIPEGFHQGHLLEHNSWVALTASVLSENNRYRKYGTLEIADKRIYMLAGFLHDLGKSGDCSIRPVYRNLNSQDAAMSVCNFIKDQGEIIGMKYHTLPAHPEEGYEYLKGYRTYKKYTLNGRENKEQYEKNTQKVYLDDWNRFFNHLNIDEFEKRLIRISVGAHWYFGDFIRKLQDNDRNLKTLVNKYLRKLETFYNDEFKTLNREDFKKVSTFVILISISDIYGSEYDPEREIAAKDYSTIKNYLPNISLSSLTNIKENTNTEVVTKIILTSIKSSIKNTNKREIFRKIKLNSEKFLRECLIQINSWKFKENNNYSLLYNLKKSYPYLRDLKTAYPDKFPKVIAFDLDQTLFAAQFYTDRETQYNIYPDTAKVIEECQKLREMGVKIALTTRHYAPKSLRKLLMKKDSPLYFANFDFIVSRYTGTKEKIIQDVQDYPNFFENNGYPNEGFIMDNKGDYYTISDKSKFLDLDKISKHGHYDLLRKRFNVEYEDILAFDDDSVYFRNNDDSNEVSALGKAKDVYVAAVLKTGIVFPLFKEGVAFYLFNRLQ